MADATHLLLNGDSFIFSPGSYAWCCKSYADYKMKECWVDSHLGCSRPSSHRPAAALAPLLSIRNAALPMSNSMPSPRTFTSACAMDRTVVIRLLLQILHTTASISHHVIVGRFTSHHRRPVAVH